ncbi:hypothetical protein KH172YL63_22980 [Bacillus sp. KH172YL63]|nr:hypothetical protein KH172YL63_22980 [Bacillus sp. KH172YL63]
MFDRIGNSLVGIKNITKMLKTSKLGLGFCEKGILPMYKRTTSYSLTIRRIYSCQTVTTVTATTAITTK